MLESYVPENFEQEAIKLYVVEESVTKVANLLNEKGHRIGARKVIGKDVSNIIRSKVTDEMHKLAQKFLKRNTNRSSRRSWL